VNHLKYMSWPAVILVIFILIGCSSNTKKEPISFPNEPLGFRGIPWGIDILETKGLALTSVDGDFRVYKRKDEDLNVDRAKIKSVTYTFYKDKFYSAMIEYVDPGNFQLLKEDLFFLYGPGEPHVTAYREAFWWEGRAVNIRLEFSKVQRKGTLAYSYKPIYEIDVFEKKEKARLGQSKI
jgi:hypothetical protein